MKKYILALFLTMFAISSCNMPLPQATQAVPLEQQAATIVAQTLTAVANNNPSIEPLATATEEQQPLASPTAEVPAATIQPNATATAGTGTPTATTLTVDSNTNCREGPGTDYKIVITLIPGSTYQIIARSDDGKYWIVTEIGKSTSCWVPVEFSNAFGNTSLLPKVTPSAPTASPSDKPTAPTGLRYNYNCAFNGDGSYTITVALGWSDRSGNEDGFYVYRNDTLIATLPANTTKYTDTLVGGASQLLKYQVAAFNATGQSIGQPQSFSCSS